MNYNNPQPLPKPSDGPAVWPLIIDDVSRGNDDVVALLLATDMQQRHEYGVAKYKEPLRPSNGRDALVDLYQEALDACAYSRQLWEEYRIAGVNEDVPRDLHRTAVTYAYNLREILHTRDGQ